MSFQSVIVNGAEYDDLTAAFNITTGAPIDGIYYGIKGVAAPPTEGIHKPVCAEVAFPGTFDGVATVELTYDPRVIDFVLCIIGALGTIATLKETLNNVLVRADGQRYTIDVPGRAERQGCKLIDAREQPEIPLGGKILLPIYCVFKQFSDVN